MKMGDYIKELRIQHGLSQDELGQKCGVQKTAVSKWEKGSVENIKRSTIKRLSEIFNVTPCELMCWDDSPTQNRPCEFQSQCQAQETFEVVSKFLMLDTTDRTRVEERIDTFLENEKYSNQEESKTG